MYKHCRRRHPLSKIDNHLTTTSGKQINFLEFYKMEWFSGNIADAVRISKEKKVIFVVFVDGKFKSLD